MRIIHFECKPEECLLHNLNYTGEFMEHHNGKGQVCKILQEGKGLNGWVDEDPTASNHTYFKRIYLNYEYDRHGVRLCYDSEKRNRLVVLKPKFEDWLINQARYSRLNMVDYDLNADANKLHLEISFKIGNLQKLIHQLIRKDNPAITKIQEFIHRR